MAHKQSTAGTTSAPQFLFDLPSDRVAQLKKIVQLGDATVLVVVHPWFPEHDPAVNLSRGRARRVSPRHLATLEQVRSQKPDYFKALNRTLRSPHPAVGIVLEETSRIASTWGRLPHGGLSRDWLIVPTIDRSPTPFVGPVKSNQAPHEEQVIAWENLSRKLRELGVRRIQICGAYFSVHEVVRQCVDGAAHCLRQLCQVEQVEPLDGPTLVLGERRVSAAVLIL